MQFPGLPISCVFEFFPSYFFGLFWFLAGFSTSRRHSKEFATLKHSIHFLLIFKFSCFSYEARLLNLSNQVSHMRLSEYCWFSPKYMVSRCLLKGCEDCLKCMTLPRPSPSCSFVLFCPVSLTIFPLFPFLLPLNTTRRRGGFNIMVIILNQDSSANWINKWVMVLCDVWIQPI